MRRESFESLPAWRQAMKLALSVHRLAGTLPADEKSGLAAGMKKASQAPAGLIAQADASEEPDAAIATLNKCETPLRELLTTALLAQQLKMLGRSDLRRLRGLVAKTRREIDDEIEAWTQAPEETPASGLELVDADQDDDDFDAIGLNDRQRPKSFWPLRRAA